MPSRRPPRPADDRPSREGRDQLNLADWPISVLRWQQPSAADGGKLRTITYEASRYDPATHRRVPQRVTLSSEEGLPTPIDEHVILALLSLAKQANNFADPKVAFFPHRIFRRLRWSADKYDYQRLRASLRRLKALTIRYENAWWDKDGREYEVEFATGIIASYHLARLTRGRKRSEDAPTSWIHWSPEFFRSLQQGNLKRLDLDRLLALRLPIAQRMYRFLDKRFHNAPTVEFDLFDFACGHLGLTRIGNVAELKRRLAPALDELGRTGFIQPAMPDERYRKIKAGVWRIRLDRATRTERSLALADHVHGDRDLSAPKLVAEWHRLRGTAPSTPSRSDLLFAAELLNALRKERSTRVLPLLADLLARKWPDAKTFAAARAYLPEAVAQLDDEDERRRQRQQTATATTSRHERPASALPVTDAQWQGLGDDQREDIRAAVLADYPWLARYPDRLDQECLRRLASRSKPTPSAAQEAS